MERQRAEIEAAFRERWPPPDAGRPRALTMPAWAEARRAISHGGLTSLDQVTFQAVRSGARPGDPLPARQPDRYTDDVAGTEVIIVGEAPGQQVAAVFSHRHFPGVRFGHRFHPDHLSGAAAQYFLLMRDIEEGGLHTMMEAGSSPDSAGVIWTVRGAPPPGLERQRAEIEASFRQGWRPAGAGKARVLTGRAYAEARAVADHGGWTGLDQETIEAVRGGAQPGDLLPPPRPYPYIDRVTDAEVIITGASPHRRVAVLFSHQDFPGARFGHHFPADPYMTALEKIWLKEEIETGALDRMMQIPPAADETGIIWTTWEDTDQDLAGPVQPGPGAAPGS
jgi:hypothetical protein